MLEILKKSLLAGIGAVVLTKEKVQEATRTFVEEGKISTDEAEKLAEELVRSGERQWEEVNAKLSDKMKGFTENITFVRDKEFNDLKTRVEMLEQRIAVLEEGHRKTVETDEY